MNKTRQEDAGFVHISEPINRVMALIEARQIGRLDGAGTEQAIGGKMNELALFAGAGGLYIDKRKDM
jgi:hypothetical protein